MNTPEHIGSFAARTLAVDPRSPLEERLLAAFWRLDLHPECQHPLLQYRLDFYFPDEKVCVEVDGKNHADRRDRDWKRDRVLMEHHGVKTMRFLGTEVHRDADWCARRVRWAIGDIRGESWAYLRKAIYG